jgi:two-component system, OmpR family, phosphate regulon sensor histidine kinase PhoR
MTSGGNAEMFDIEPTILTWGGRDPAAKEVPPRRVSAVDTPAADGPLSRSTRDRRANGVVADDLVAENERLRKLVKLQADLVASVAHDLRTPLTSVLGFTDMLLKRDFEPAARDRYLRIVNGEMRRFARLIDDLYDAQLIAAGRNVLSLGVFDLGHLLLEQVDLFSGQDDLHALQLEVPSRPLLVEADRERIARVIANLLSNAIKYSPNGGTITIAADAQDGVVRVAVSDNGIGIPSDQQHRVFAKFFRADSSSSGIKGVGLGLSLCREIVHAHGGALGFDSAYGHGSTFWFELRDDADPEA